MSNNNSTSCKAKLQEAQLLRHAARLGVVGNVRAKHGHSELVHGALLTLLVPEGKYLLLRFRPQHDCDVLIEDLQREALA